MNESPSNRVESAEAKTKACSNCKRTFVIHRFKLKKGVRTKLCKTCLFSQEESRVRRLGKSSEGRKRLKRRNARRQRMIARHLARQARQSSEPRECIRCKQLLPAVAFLRNKKTVIGRCNECQHEYRRVRHNQLKREFYKKNPDYVREKNKRFLERNPGYLPDLLKRQRAEAALRRELKLNQPKECIHCKRVLAPICFKSIQAKQCMECRAAKVKAYNKAHRRNSSPCNSPEEIARRKEYYRQNRSRILAVSNGRHRKLRQESSATKFFQNINAVNQISKIYEQPSNQQQ